MIGLRVHLKEDFSVIRETLERIGIKNTKTKTFFPSCYCVETKEEGVYTIVHFKELFIHFNRKSDYDNLDKLRLKTIVQLLKNWDLVEPIDQIDEIMSEKIHVLSHKEKKDYEIIHKFRFTKKIIVE